MQEVKAEARAGRILVSKARGTDCRFHCRDSFVISEGLLSQPPSPLGPAGDLGSNVTLRGIGLDGQHLSNPRLLRPPTSSQG